VISQSIDLSECQDLVDQGVGRVDGGVWGVADADDEDAEAVTVFRRGNTNTRNSLSSGRRNPYRRWQEISEGGDATGHIPSGTNNITLELYLYNDGDSDIRLDDAYLRIKFLPTPTPTHTPTPTPTPRPSCIPIAFEKTVSGSIENMAPGLNYCFTASAGQWVSIRMFRFGNGTLDPYLRLYGPDGQSAAQNDNGVGIGSNSFLTYQFPRNGTYRLEAGRLGDGYGEFRLRLENGREAAVGDINQDCEVNLNDLSWITLSWGTSEQKADLNLDGTVNQADLEIAETNWGYRCGQRVMLTPTPTPTPTPMLTATPSQTPSPTPTRMFSLPPSSTQTPTGTPTRTPTATRPSIPGETPTWTPLPPGDGSIVGYIFQDLNNNGIRDSEEPGLTLVHVLLEPGGKSTRSSYGKGWYEFNNLGPGTYTLDAKPPDGYVPSMDLPITVNVRSDTPRMVNLGFRKSAAAYTPTPGPAGSATRSIWLPVVLRHQ